MFNLSFVKDKLRGFRLWVSTRIKNHYIELYVREIPQEDWTYTHSSELTAEQLYVFELEKAGRLRKVAKGMWQYTK